MKLILYPLLVCLASVYLIDAANVLVIFPVPSFSHQILGNELVKALIKKGHHVTMASPYHMKEKLENYTEIVLEGMLEYKERSFGKLMGFNSSKLEGFKTMLNQNEMAKITITSPGMQKLMKSDKKFDLVLQEVMLCEGLLGFGHFFKAPTVIVSSFGSVYMYNNMVGNSQPLAYVPTNMFGYTDEMTFAQRVINAVFTYVMDGFHTFLLLSQQQRLITQYFPDAPPLDDLLHNISLILFNTHFSVVETPRPYLPNMIPIGGFHVQPQELPKDLKEFLDAAEEGVVLFSLGSNVKSTDLPQDKIDIILKTFSKFPQQFLWKFENENVIVPKNVRISKWLPQRAVLDHPNTKAFITHGGLLSITEAVYYGVPFIGIPAFGDQQYNMAVAVHKKFGIEYDINELNEKTLTDAVREILENPMYRENIAIRSSLLREQPIPPLDLAVYWIEHVIKYKGAPHLRSAGLKLKWYQGYLLDVIAFLVAVSSVILYVNYIIVRKCLRFVCKKFCTKQKLKSA